MKKTTLGYKSALISGAITCALLSQYTQAQTIGVFGLFKTQSEGIQKKSIEKLEKQVATMDCILRREGKILAVQGDYNTPTVNGFFLLECRQDFLRNSQSQIVIKELRNSIDHLALIEGSINQFGRLGLAKPGNNNSYIFKLSDYNNSAPERRNNDLIKLNNIVNTRTDKYKNEAFIRVNNAYGMKRPDEVVVIYYDSVESGERFRANNKNQEIMALIGKFNKDHLTRAGYSIAKSNR